MNELIRRLSRYPLVSVELLAASFFVTLLNLASPLYVIQILNRYVTFGFDGTLITLTAGMVLALILLFGFRTARTRLAAAVSMAPDQELETAVLTALSRIRAEALDALTKPRAQEMLTHVQVVQGAYDAPNITTVLDAPFAVLYILAAFLLSPILGIVGLAGMLVTLATGWLSLRLSVAPARDLQQATAALRGHAASALHGSDTVRAFQGAGFLQKVWQAHVRQLNTLRKRLSEGRGLFQNAAQSSSLFMSVLLYAIGAVEVVRGEVTIGALIGVNILAMRAYQCMSGLSQSLALMAEAREALGELDTFLRLPLEAETGSALRQYRGQLEFKDVSFAYPGSSGPLFESLNLRLDPGTFCVVRGFNGSGKTTLARLLLGLLEPTRGEILADGLNLRQLAPFWWRRQVMYLPQEPTFLNTTIKENLLLANPEVDPQTLSGVVGAANLNRYLFTSPAGLDTPVVDSGRNLPLGVRRRLALARALLSGGPLAVFDEPTEGLDAEGCHAVFGLLQQLAKAGKTLVVCSLDPNVLRMANLCLDLSAKPVPMVRVLNAGKDLAAPANTPTRSDAPGTQTAP